MCGDHEPERETLFKILHLGPLLPSSQFEPWTKPRSLSHFMEGSGPDCRVLCRKHGVRKSKLLLHYATDVWVYFVTPALPILSCLLQSENSNKGNTVNRKTKTR